ncbi:hypothetical protein LA080_010395 [Diaporthe eres]|nr:hypothetical protein LA080_010395 [Diaporthe eres]
MHSNDMFSASLEQIRWLGYLAPGEAGLTALQAPCLGHVDTAGGSAQGLPADATIMCAWSSALRACSCSPSLNTHFLTPLEYLTALTHQDRPTRLFLQVRSPYHVLFKASTATHQLADHVTLGCELDQILQNFAYASLRPRFSQTMVLLEPTVCRVQFQFGNPRRGRVSGVGGGGGQAVLYGLNLTLEIMELCKLRYESTLAGFKLSLDWAGNDHGKHNDLDELMHASVHDFRGCTSLLMPSRGLNELSRHASSASIIHPVHPPKIGVPPRKDKCFSNYDWSHCQK